MQERKPRWKTMRMNRYIYISVESFIVAFDGRLSRKPTMAKFSRKEEQSEA